MIMNRGNLTNKSLMNLYPFILIFTIFSLNTWQISAANFDVAILQGLDKVTARVSTFKAPIGSTIKFGTLQIIAKKCVKRPPEETPESAVFLVVDEVRQGESSINVYKGWMFASSPALAAMEHPVYDVWVLDCA